MAVSTAPDFRLPAARAGEVALSRPGARAPALLVFCAEECPTSRLALRRLAAVAPQLPGDGIELAVVFEDPLPLAARTARAAGLDAEVLSEPPPYDTSRAYDLVSVPTAVLVTPDGREAGRVVGWDLDAWNGLLAAAADLAGAAPRTLPADEPRTKPGCAAKSTYDAATLALDAAAAGAVGLDEHEDLFERGWTDGLPVVPPTPERVAAMLGGRDPQQTLGPCRPAWARRRSSAWPPARCSRAAGPPTSPWSLAACEAALEDDFNLNGQAVTTSPPGQLVVVNGPVRDAIGLHAGMGALGSGLAREPHHRPRPAPRS